jgi:hypothetical protein
MNAAHICWAIPNYGPIWAPAYETHMRVIAKTSRHLTVSHLGGMSGLGITDRMPLDMAENALTEQFLALPDATHLFLTESDMLLPDDTLLRLLALDKPIASGLFFLRGGYGQPCLYKKLLGLPGNPYAKTPISLFPLTEPFKLNGCPGVGCVLIQRQVFERVGPPWFEIQAGHHGSDMFFYTKAMDAGYEVWVDPLVACEQIEYIIWGLHHYQERLRQDPMFAAQGGIIGSAEVAYAAS